MHILGLKPEMILYFYMASCVAVLIFNVLYIFIDKFQGQRLMKKSEDMEMAVRQCMELPDSEILQKEEHFSMLSGELKRVTRLQAFQFAMEKVLKEYPAEAGQKYKKEVRKVFLKLTEVYEKRDSIEQAYFASLIEEFEFGENGSVFDGITNFLLVMVTSSNIYVRENALKAIYASGNKEAVLSAYEKLNDNEIYHSRKLLADGLLGFAGDRDELSGILWSRYAYFSPELLLPVMQFIRFHTGNYREEFCRILEEERTEKELKLEAIRYFRRYPYEPVRETLQNYIRFQEFIDWEYGALSALALEQYPGPDTVEVLKDGLKAVNWYVRLNCAQTLIEGLKVPQLALFDVYNGKDRYAREILQYVSQKTEIREQEMEL